MFQFYVILIVFILLTVAIQEELFRYMHTVKKQEKENVNAPDDRIQLENIINRSGGLKKLNCMKQTHYCLNSIDCSDVCDSSNMQYICDKESFTCHPLSINSTSTKQIECNKKSGFLTAVSISPLTGIEYVCLNRLPDYYDDSGIQNQFVCNGGILNVTKTIAGVPTFKSCTCPPDKIRITNTDRPEDVPRCIDKKFLKFLPSFSEK